MVISQYKKPLKNISIVIQNLFLFVFTAELYFARFIKRFMSIEKKFLFDKIFGFILLSIFFFYLIRKK